MIRRGRLLEVVDGIEIRAKVREDADPLALVAGRRGRLERGGVVYEVDRVGQGAAYLHRVYDPPVLREWGDAEARDAALEALRAYVLEGKDDGSSARRLTQEALRAAAKVKRIEVARGPCEPGISRSTRFVERVYPEATAAPVLAGVAAEDIQAGDFLEVDPMTGRTRRARQKGEV